MSGLSTETLRKIYADGDVEREWFFDTWLAKHDAWTAEAEREHIIKLLERKADKVLESGAGRPMPQKMEFIAVEHSIRELIALIKGENK